MKLCHVFIVFSPLLHVNRLQAREEDMATEVEDLKRELSHANELLTSMKQKSLTLGESEVLSLSPAAAKASAMLKSGLSLTQIYSQYVEVGTYMYMYTEG